MTGNVIRAGIFAGLAGGAVYFFKQKIVLPLSLAGAQNPDVKGMSIGIAIHIVLFGVPMAYAARRLLKRELTHANP